MDEPDSTLPEGSEPSELPSMDDTIRDTLRRNEVIVEDLTDKFAESQAFDEASDVPKIEGTPAPDWKHEHLGTWDRVKGAVRHAWERVRSS